MARMLSHLSSPTSTFGPIDAGITPHLPPPHRPLQRILTAAISICALIALAAGCSGDDIANDEPDTAADRGPGVTIEGGAPAPGSETTTTTIVIDLPEGAAGDTTATLRESIPMTDPEAACVAEQLDADTNTLAELTDTPDPDSDAYATAGRIARDCSAHITYIPELTDTITADRDTTPAQQNCLTDTLTTYNADELTALATGGTIEGKDLDAIVADCGIT